MKEIEELQSSNRNKVLVVAVALVAIAAGLHFALGTPGTGKPEEAHRVMIVASGTVNLHAYVGELGFEAVGGDFEAWREQVVVQEEGYDDPEAVDLPALLDFADRYGYGYVMVEEPQRFELGGLGLEFSTDEAAGHQDPASIPDRVRFGVISVGDFSGPHVLTTELSGRELHDGAVDVGLGPRALRALFAQPKLAMTLEENPEATATQTLRLKLIDALGALARIDRLEVEAAGMAEHERELLESIAVKGKPEPARPLVQTLEGGAAYPLADGRVLVRGVQARPSLLHEGRSINLSIDLAPRYTYSAIAPEHPAAAAGRAPCPELTGGGGLRGELARFELSAAGDALFVLEESGAGSLFELDPGDPSLGPCGLRKVASFMLPEHTRSSFAVHRGAVATREVVDGHLSGFFARLPRLASPRAMRTGLSSASTRLDHPPQKSAENTRGDRDARTAPDFIPDARPPGLALLDA